MVRRNTSGLLLTSLICIAIEVAFVMFSIIAAQLNKAASAALIAVGAIFAIFGLLSFIFHLRKYRLAKRHINEDSNLLDSEFIIQAKSGHYKSSVFIQTINFFYGIINLILFFAIVVDYFQSENGLGENETFSVIVLLIYTVFVLSILITGFIGSFIIINNIIWYLKNDGIIK
ncbi:MAG: hypothetical protein ACPGLV_03240 [Bacteroidia bacterium]